MSATAARGSAHRRAAYGKMARCPAATGGTHKHDAEAAESSSKATLSIGEKQETTWAAAGAISPSRLERNKKTLRFLFSLSVPPCGRTGCPPASTDRGLPSTRRVDHGLRTAAERASAGHCRSDATNHGGGPAAGRQP
eukprot:scaffold2041_cov110-Isochrysis_galbana.AAC.10